MRTTALAVAEAHLGAVRTEDTPGPDCVEQSGRDVGQQRPIQASP